MPFIDKSKESLSENERIMIESSEGEGCYQHEDRLQWNSNTQDSRASERIVINFEELHDQIIWYEDTDTGEPVGSGIYFCCLETGHFSIITKFILLTL